MFDVDWSDPNRESVGDRRARKQKHQDSTGGASSQNDDHEHDHDQDQDGERTSGSVRSSVSSVEKQFGLFGGKYRKKGVSSSRKGKGKSVAGSSLRSRTIEEQPQDEATAVPSSDIQRIGQAGVEEPSGLPTNRFSSFADSVFSKLDETDCAPGGSLFGCDTTNPQQGSITLYQELGDGVSMITKTTVVSVRDRTDEDSDCLVSQAHISAGDFDQASFSKSKTNSPKSSPSKSTHSIDPTQFAEVVRMATACPASQGPDLPRIPAANEVDHLPVIAESSIGEAVSRDFARQKQKRPARPKLSAPAITPASLRPTGNLETWRAPDDWVMSPAEPVVSGQVVEDALNLAANTHVSDLTLDVAHMQREIDRMFEASPQVILQRLKDKSGYYEPTLVQDQDPTDDSAIADALAHQEREMEKKRWLLSALYNMETIWDPEEQLSRPASQPTVQKVLSLFESKGTASYLAVMHNTVPVYHLAADPLDHRQYPNVHPAVCPTVSASALSFAAESFSSVSCLNIISILPSSEIPRLLQNINRVLAPSGYLHLVIIDPWPVASSMGPRLQRWIDENLVFNLELQFRCTHPSRMFPVWLDEARLRAAGSIITHTRFLAIPQAYDRRGDDDSDAASARSKGSAEEEAAIKKELRTTVGRMMWQEIWGPFVTGDKWWWEMPEIVDECVAHQTHWEYKLIAACKAAYE